MRQWMRVWAGLAAVLAGCAGENSIVRRPAQFGTEADSVKVMTFNIRFGTAADGANRWDVRREGVFERIARQGADVVGLQEALEFQVVQIQQAVSGYGVIEVTPKSAAQKGEWCSILYRKDRFRVAESGVFWFSNTPWKPGSMHWGNKMPRICVWGRLVEKSSGRAFYVYNVHLDHQSQVSRQKSVELLARRVAEREPKEPVVVMGDFNAGLDDTPLLFLRRLGYPNAPVELLDSWRRRHPDAPDGRTYHGFKGGVDGYEIDHILAELATDVLDAQIDRSQNASGGYPSDHYPVTATLKLWSAQK